MLYVPETCKIVASPLQGNVTNDRVFCLPQKVKAPRYRLGEWRDLSQLAADSY